MNSLARYGVKFGLTIAAWGLTIGAWGQVSVPVQDGPAPSPPAPTPAPAVLRLTTDGLDKFRPYWFPDGKTLLYARQEPGNMQIYLYLQPIGSDGLPQGSPQRMSDRKDPEYDGVLAPDGGRTLFTMITRSGTQGDLDLALWDCVGKNAVKVAENREGQLSHQESGAWAPDGQRIAFVSTHDKNPEIYLVQPDGQGLTRVTQHPGLDTHPCWSPDGKSLVITTERWGGLELAMIDPTGQRITRLTTSPGLDDYAQWSPDGRHLGFVTNRDRQWEIYMMGADGSHPVNLSQHPARDTLPVWTPDGQRITFVSNRDGGMDLYTLTIPTP